MTCSYCSTDLPAGALFCGECGRAVSSVSTSARVPPIETVPPVEPAETAEPPETAEPDARSKPVSWITSDDRAGSINDDREACADCATPFATSDIFCGECGAVRPLPRSAAPQTSTVESAITTNSSTVSASGAEPTAPLDPFPWGLPAGSVEIDLDESILAGAVETPVQANSSEAPDSEPDVEQTRIVGMPAMGVRFVLQFSTGESVTLSGTGLLGRNPTPEPGEYFDSLVTIVDPGRSVSKTHLEFGQESGSFWVSDRFSGNGTVVRDPDRDPVRCDAGKRYFVGRGSRIEIGEQFFIIS